MSILQSIRNIFKRGKYVMTSQSLGNITEHPKIAINKDEYDRIQKN